MLRFQKQLQLRFKHRIAYNVNDSFITVLDKVNLSKMEGETLNSFRANPNNRTFLAVSQILYKYNFSDNGIQLLMKGVQQHPSYSAARVVLAEKLYLGSIFQESWDILEQSPVSLRTNKTAQILSFRLSLILGLEDRHRRISSDMEASGQLEQEFKSISDEIEINGFQDVRKIILDQLDEEGFEVADLIDGKELRQKEVIQESHFDEDSRDSEDPVLMDRLIEGFYVAPISELFSKDDEENSEEAETHNLDAVTLAHVYRKQGRYDKSLEIYQRLLYMAPNNDLFKKQVEEVKSLKEEQNRRERNLDPDLVERLDDLQLIDSKIANLNSLLSKLDEYESKNKI